MSHTFHIPVLGLAFSVDTPLKVAKYGISSVASIVDDQLVERMRKYHLEKNGKVYQEISLKEPDFRSKRITEYLNMMDDFVNEQFENLKAENFENGKDINHYFNLLPDRSSLKQAYIDMMKEKDLVLKHRLQLRLKESMQKGAIDVNIMAKVDKLNFNKSGEEVNSDALEALKGFALSKLNSSVVLSAGMNQRLYAYIENFRDFYPDLVGNIRKRVILKVSDFRSALIQGKMLAKKGLWISEFRIESGLNCGGHAFATEGYLLGPILEEFKQKKDSMLQELFAIYEKALEEKNIKIESRPMSKISVQGGIGTAEEDNFLLEHYQLDATGWGSPFLLVPEATNVDEQTLKDLICADRNDFYISGSSPLGVPFNNFRLSSVEKLRQERIEKGRPGSPCTKKYLVSNTEFTEEPICTASREYQNLKIKSLKESDLSEEEYQREFQQVTEKICLCEGLVTSAYIKNDMLKPKENKAVAICPGPNIAYFSGEFTLEEMVKHIYGKVNLLSGSNRSNIFINELSLYVDYLKKDISNSLKDLNDKKVKYFSKFQQQLENGIDYYKSLIPAIHNQTDIYKKRMMDELLELETKLLKMKLA
ncbi:hypothetical protein Pedsa_0379 [Pseudopedobacter saltans DSM 12145]|uniref:Uncharacterized protein n=1 Tax=Pseudopedobacter saltans (strain ATCC 51119 / DSM 12145 / JCM 21818 / CCUG 39354 / LMG 10337 / NBRC 100064 / NCIMB 13643) TaxID=762903 RepID=F0S544_PSESL|nr:hypothetical protein [Pseudopedobacter saltans]ADY50961.1 hypothetical protein Pedsa_0379 [Pseudopedobacter saltans DSM 12145]